MADLRGCPEAVQDVAGFALFMAQSGSKHPAAKALNGQLRGLMEIVDDWEGNTYRVVYTAKLAGAIYVLHVFQKRATNGIGTPRHVIGLIKGRYRRAQEHHRRQYAAKEECMGNDKVTRSSGSVFADLGRPQPEERLAKAALALELSRLIRARGLTQKGVAEQLGIDQPKVSHLLHGRLAGFSTERLLRFLTALGRDVEIIVKAPPHSRRRGRLRVIAA